ncbi:hypothetical protein HN51_055733, partial [Arachis hypogaea]
LASRRASAGKCSSRASCSRAAYRRRPPSLHPTPGVLHCSRLASARVSPRLRPSSPLFRGFCCLNCCLTSTF